MALLRGTLSLGLPRVTPRALAAARACRVRVLISARCFSASAAKRWRTNGSTSGPSRRPGVPRPANPKEAAPLRTFGKSKGFSQEELKELRKAIKAKDEK